MNKNKTVRYVLDRDVRYLIKDLSLFMVSVKNADFCSDIYLSNKVEVLCSRHPIFVNLLEKSVVNGDEMWHVKLFYENGEVQEGWVLESVSPLKIHNMEELFDGRFNA